MSNYVVGSPSSLGTLTATGIRRMAWESKLRRDSVRPSLWTVLKSAIKVVDKVMSVQKSGVFMEVSEPPESAQSTRLAMVKPLQRAPQMGTGEDVLGNEDESDLVWTELFYNEIKKGVKYKQWGYDYNDTKYLKVIETYADQMTNFIAENFDCRCHQALTVTFANELTYTPVSQVRQFNKNWCIPNQAEATYTPTALFENTAMTDTANTADSHYYYPNRTFSGVGSMVENLAAALMSASGTGATSKALFTYDFLAQLETYLSDTILMEPVMLDGIPTYVIIVASNVWAWTMNPDNSGSIGSYIKAVKTYKDDARITIPGELGRAFESLLFVRNRRAPTLQVSGGSGTYSIKVNYCNPGNNDARNKSAWAATSGATNFAFDLCYAVGANALAEYVVDPVRSNMTEHTEYGKIEGRAAYMGSGIQIPCWDKDSASRLDGTSITMIQRSSVVIPVSRAAVETVV